MVNQTKLAEILETLHRYNEFFIFIIISTVAIPSTFSRISNLFSRLNRVHEFVETSNSLLVLLMLLYFASCAFIHKYAYDEGHIKKLFFINFIFLIFDFQNLFFYF